MCIGPAKYPEEIDEAKLAKYESLGYSCFRKGNYEQSLMYYQCLLSVSVELNDLDMASRAYGGMGHANKAMGKLVDAQYWQKLRLKLCIDVGDKEGQVSSLSHLGHLHKVVGNFREAMLFYSKSLEVMLGMKNQKSVGRAYGNLGSCYIAMGNYQGALTCYQQKLEIAHWIPSSLRSKATSLNHLGAIYLSLNKKELALVYMQQGLKIAQEISDKKVECQAFINLVNYYISIKKPSKVVPHLNRALQLASEQKHQSNREEMLKLCHKARGEYKKLLQKEESEDGSKDVTCRKEKDAEAQSDLSRYDNVH